MGRKEQVSSFWIQQPAVVDSMYLRKNSASFAEEEQNELISLLPDLSQKTVLELASGIGRLTRHLSSRARHLTSIDFISHFVEKNRRDHAACLNVDWVCADVMHLELEKHSLDVVFFNWLLMYLEDSEMKVLMQKISDWLRPGGYLFFRESCALKTARGKKSDYYVTYRSLSDYDKLIQEHFVLIREGHIQAYVNHFADPFQCFWLGQKG